MMPIRLYSPTRAIVGCCVALSMLALSVCAQAQPAAATAPLDLALIAANDTWGDDQKTAVSQYLQSHVNRMLAGEEPAIQQGRDGIMKPFQTAGVSESFIRQYCQAVAHELKPAMESPTLQVRVNAMLICGRLPNDAALEPITTGIQDKNAGVRYLAAIALTRLIAQDLIQDEPLNQILGTVGQQLAVEESSHVASPLFKVLVDASAFDTLLATLNTRLSWHVEHPAVGFSPEAQALQDTYTKFFSGAGTPSQCKALARASVRYMRLAAQQLAAESVNDPASNVATLRVTQTALAFLRERFKSSEREPSGFTGALAAKKWDKIIKIADRWSDLLQAAPIGMDPAQLQITPVTAEQAESNAQ